MHFAKVFLTDPSEGNSNFNVSAKFLLIKGNGGMEKNPEYNSDGVRTAAVCLLLQLQERIESSSNVSHC